MNHFMKQKIIFFGTSGFAIPTLEKLKKSPLFDVSAVVTQTDKPFGRGKKLQPSPVKAWAKKNSLKVFEFLNKNDLNALMKNIDLAILTDFGKIIPKEILEMPKFGFLNIHPSLLPKYRGPSPISGAILAGDKKTGVSIIKMIEEVDAGPIIVQEKVEISSDDTQISLSQKLSQKGTDLLIKILPDYLEGKIKLREQNKRIASYTKLLTKNDGEINWQQKAETIEKMVRALTPWPSAYAYWNGKMIKILSSNIYSGNFKLAPGTVFLTESKKAAVAASEKSLILEIIQIEGKNPTKGEDFLRGHSNFIGSILS